VLDGVTGFVVDPPDDVTAVAAAIDRLLGDADLRGRLASESRRRAVEQFSYEVLARRLREALAALA